MSRQWTPKRPTVELSGTAEQRPSRIRRDPPPAVAEPKALRPHPTEREVWTVVIGVVLFGVAIMIITLGFSHITA